MTDTIVMNGENVDSKSKDDFKLKSIDKLFELPIATSINNKVLEATTPVINNAKEMINPMTEKLGPLLDFVRLKLEDNGVPSVPHSVSSAVDVASNNLVSVADTVDSYASNGIDLLTEKVPTLKEETPVFIEETRSSISTFWANIYNFAMTFELFKMFVMTLAVFLDISFDEKLPEKEENQFPKKEINELQKADSKIKTKSKTKVNFLSKVNDT